MNILMFILGSMLGGTVGVFAMCLMQVNREREKDVCNNEGTESKPKTKESGGSQTE